MKQIGKRILSMLCVLTMMLSNVAMIVPGTYADQIDSQNEIDGIHEAHLISLRDYSYFAYDANEGTTQVDDAEAFGGKAVCYSRANFAGNDFIALHRYESATGVDAPIAQLFLADLKVNQGYQIYKFSYDVPANATENGVLYIMPNWQLNSSQLCKDFYAYAGKTVEIYLSMKVSGPNADGKYSVSVDRVALASLCKDHLNAEGTACTLCGDAEEGTDITAITFLAQDIQVPYASAGLCDSKVDDPTSAYGKAVKLSYTERYATGDAGLWKPMLYLPGQASLIYANNGSDTKLGMITSEEMQENAAGGVYVTYTFENLNLSGQNFVYLFDWSVQTRFNADQKNFFEGKLVNMTVSMKVTGDVTGADASNPPCYYIDCITYQDTQAHTHTCESFTYENDSLHTGVCSGCGETVKESHTWDEGVVTTEPTAEQEGEKLYTCSVCNGTKTEKLDKLGDTTVNLTFLADDITLPYYTANLCDSKVDDPTSAYGKAIMLSYTDRYATGDAGLWKPMLYLPEQAALIYANNGSDTNLGMITGAEMAENAAGGAYVTYTFSGLDLKGQNFVYLFDWSVQTRFNDEQKAFFATTLVDMTVSMKVVGDVTGADASNYPAYYIDCISYAKAGDHQHTITTYTYLNETQHSAVCSGCGETVKENHKWDNGVVTVAPTADAEGEKVYTCSVCNGTKTEVLDKLGNTQVNLTFLADDITLPYFTSGVCDSKVEDSTSAYGKAIKLSYAERYATGNAGLWKPMLYMAGQASLIYANGNGDFRIGMITSEEMQENAAAGVYITYTFADLDLSGRNFVYLFDWSVQTKFNDDQKAFFETTLVDMTVSMKVTGDVTGADTSNPPVYYIDCISYAAADQHEHSCTEYTYLNEAQHSGTCSGCGETIKENHKWNDGVVTVQPTVSATGEKVYTCSVCNGTKTQVLDQLEDIGSTIIFLADDIVLPYFTSGVCDSKVEDADSAHGKAIKLSYAERFATGDAGLWKPMLYTEEQAMLIYANGGGDLRIGMITGVELAENAKAGKYVEYTFSDLNLSGKDFVYLFDWAVQARFSDAQKTFLADKLVNMTVSMKVTGDVSGADTAKPPVYYIDSIRFDAVEGTHVHSCDSYTYLNEKVHSGTCSSCGETVKENHKWDEGVITVEPTVEKTGEKLYTCSVCNGTRVQVLAKLEELTDTLTFYADDLTVPYFTSGVCDSVESDTLSAYGKAVVLSYADRFATGDEGLWKPMLYTEEQAALIYANGGGDVRIGMITGAEMAENAKAGKYVAYKFNNLNLSGRDFVYLFDWAIQARFTDAHKAFFTDKLVNMTISMRVTGDVTGQNTAKPPVYYIDCIKFEVVGEEHIHQYGEGTYVDENQHSVVCAGCGEKVKEAHKWDEGVVTVEPTAKKEGEKLFTCTVCGGTKTQVLPKKNDKVLTFLAGDLTVPYATSGLCDSKVSDADSKYGMAVKLSYAERLATGDQGLYNIMLYTEEQAALIYANGGGDVRIGMITGAEMAENANTGKYVTYKFNKLNLSGKDFVYLFDWAVQARFTDEHKAFFTDKQVDMTISMKITGDVTGQDASNPPAYYIDYISFEVVGKEHVHLYGSGTYVDENQHSVVCSGCGEKVKEEHKWDEGVVTVEPTAKKEGKKLFTCTVCGGTKTQILPKKSDKVLTFLAGDLTVPYAESGLCDAKVSDPNSKYGMAVKLSYADRFATGDQNLYKTMIYTEEQAALIYANGGGDVRLGMITGAEMAENAKAGKYVAYKFSKLNLSGRDFVYLFDWAVQARFTDEDKAFFTDKLVDMTISMRVTGDVTGQDASNPPAYYIDYISFEVVGEEHVHRYTEGTYIDENQHSVVCDGCGEKIKESHKWDEGIVTVEPTSKKEGKKVFTCTVCGGTRTQILPKKNDKVLTFLAGDLKVPYAESGLCDSKVSDPNSKYGMAVKLSYAERLATGDQGLYKVMLYTEEQAMLIYANGGGDVRIGMITGAEMAENAAKDKYVAYKFSKLNLTDKDFIYLFDWAVQARFTDEQKEFFVDKLVDMTISMKVTGDVTGQDASNPPVYYIDYISFEIVGEEHIHRYTEGTYLNENQHSAVCAGCGKKTKEDHKWDEGVVTVEPTEKKKGEKVFTCTVCGGTKTQVLPKKNSKNLIFLAGDLTVPYAESGLCDSKVSDPDSKYGMAVKLSYAERYKTGDAVLYNVMLYTEEQAMLLYSHGEKDVNLGMITGEQFAKNAKSGKYVTYTFKHLDLDGQDFVYLFDWAVQARFSEEQKAFFVEKWVDMTVSLKVTGDVTGQDAKNPPVYYIDYISFKVVGENHTHKYTEGTCVDDDQHIGVCTGCGKKVKLPHEWNEGVIEVEPTEEKEGKKVYTCSVCNHTRIQILNKVTKNEIDEIHEKHLISLRGYESFAMDANEGTTYVEDADAYNGMAVCYTGAKLAEHPFITINRYDVASGYEDGAPEMKIGGLSLSEVKVNKGYRVYKFIYNVPKETTEGNTFYIMSNWQLNSPAICADFAAYAGKTVEVYLSMKVTGPTEDGFYSVFVDRVALASACENYAAEDGVTCEVCGGSLLEQPAEMPIIIPAENFLLPYAPTDSVVEDADSPYGWAAMFSYDKRVVTGDKGLCNSMIRDNGLSLGMYTYDGAENHLVGRITLNQLRSNSYAGKYKTYTFWNVPLISENGDEFAYLFDCWGLQLRFNESQLLALRGKRVDITVSLKVTGNVSSTSNAPSYYIDYIEIAEASGRSCGHEDSTWTFVDDKEHNFACAICGKTWNEEHRWDEGVEVEGVPEGMRMYTCLGCKKSAIRGEEALPIVFLAENFTLPYGAAFGCDKVVDDPDSKFGKAVVVSYLDRLATGDKGLYEQMLKMDGQEMRLYKCNGADSKLIGGIDGSDLRKNAKNGQYVTYEFKEIMMTDVSFIYMLECWGVQARFSQEQLDAMEGKLVDIALSMKVTGDPSDVNNPPAYYIESLILSLSEKQIVHEHTYNEYISIDENQHTCTCAECGEVLTENHKWDAGKIVKDSTTGEDQEILYTCTLCGATKTKALGNQFEDVGQNGGVISNELLIWAICVGLSDVAIVIFIITMIKKRKKK